MTVLSLFSKRYKGNFSKWSYEFNFVQTNRPKVLVDELVERNGINPSYIARNGKLVGICSTITSYCCHLGFRMRQKASRMLFSQIYKHFEKSIQLTKTQIMIKKHSYQPTAPIYYHIEQLYSRIQIIPEPN